MNRFQAAALATLILGGTTAGAFAQATTTPGTTDSPATTARVDNDDDDGFDLGWLGLLGLIGLAGLRGRKHDVRVATTTTGRPHV